MGVKIKHVTSNGPEAWIATTLHLSQMEAQRTAALMRTTSTLIGSRKSLGHLLKELSISDTMSAASADVARRIVLGQLQNLNHSTLTRHDIDGSKRVFGSPATTSIINTEFSGASRTLEEGQLHKKRAPAIELYINSSSA